ncbi:hypothetical protein C8Q78DRAFT_213426 [Trametes maxima]|nr:hypothetical protein C8Q78DRAFT_213426 [Trametes maxima]
MAGELRILFYLCLESPEIAAANGQWTYDLDVQVRDALTLLARAPFAESHIDAVKTGGIPKEASVIAPKLFFATVLDIACLHSEQMPQPLITFPTR